MLRKSWDKFLYWLHKDNEELRLEALKELKFVSHGGKYDITTDVRHFDTIKLKLINHFTAEEILLKLEEQGIIKIISKNGSHNDWIITYKHKVNVNYVESDKLLRLKQENIQPLSYMKKLI